MFSGIVIYLSDAYLSLFICLQDGVHYLLCGLAKGNFCYYKSVFVDFLDICPYSYLPSSKSSVVSGGVCKSSSGEIGLKEEIFTLEVCYGCVDEFIEVMRKNF